MSDFGKSMREARAMMNKPGDPNRPTNRPTMKKAKARKNAENKQLSAQTRKILGKHYANKYRTGRS